jgi:hypothetical protein
MSWKGRFLNHCTSKFIAQSYRFSRLEESREGEIEIDDMDSEKLELLRKILCNAP